MSKKEDFYLALQCLVLKDSVPVWELEFQCWDSFSGKHLLVGTEFVNLTRLQQQKALRANAEIIINVAKELCFSAVTVPNSYWEVAPGQPSYYWLPEEVRYDQAKILFDMAGSELAFVGVSGGVMGIPAAEDYVEFSMKLFDAPEEIDEIANSFFSRGIESVKKLRDVGIETVLTASDLADNKGPFYSPSQMDRFVLPYLVKWVQQAKQMGLYTIIHTDGNIYPCLDEVVKSGVNALQAIDPTAGMDMETTKKRVADSICLCGNIDSGLLITASPEEIYDQTKKLLLTCKSYSGIVLGASNAVVAETPPNNYKAMIRAWKEYG